MLGAAFAEGKVAEHEYGYEGNQSATKSHEVSDTLLPLGSSLVFWFFGFWSILKGPQKTKSFAAFREG